MRRHRHLPCGDAPAFRADDDTLSRGQAAALALAADLEHSVPLKLEGEHGWYAVAERVLAAPATTTG
jgi:hypothetical protein